jgi:hypothetical protein
MFSLDKHDATITNVNFRKQNHGDQKVAAVDIAIEMKASSLLLDLIDPKLRKAFFAKPGKGEQQALPIDGNNLTALALPFLGEQKLSQEFEDYEVYLHSLLEHIDPVFFLDAKVKKLAFTPIEGGSIELTLAIAVRIDEDDDAALLSAWRRGEIQLSLTPPTAKPAQEDLAADDGEGLPAAA